MKTRCANIGGWFAAAVVAMMMSVAIPVHAEAAWVRDVRGWWWQKGDGCYPVPGWELIDGTWYYFAEPGYMATGWQLVDGSWYYFGEAEDGAMRSGWQLINGSWYYLGEAGDGAMKSGWQLINGSWYYLGEAGDGAMKSGWQLINGSWYYLGEAGDGAMKSGWQQINGSWYYLGEAGDGAMKSGWQLVDGTWYYLSDDGRMAADAVVDGYYVDGSGAWVPGASGGASEKGVIDTREIPADEEVSYGGIEGMAANCDLAFYGEVEEVKTEPTENGFCSTFESVRVIEPLSGDVVAGDVVLVARDSGILSARDYVNSYATQEGKDAAREEFASYADEELGDIYIEYRYTGDVRPQAGQKAVFFLIKSTSHEENGSYVRMEEAFGEYLEISDNQFLCNVDASDGEESGEVEDMQGDASPSYTLEEIRKLFE